MSQTKQNYFKYTNSIRSCVRVMECMFWHREYIKIVDKSFKHKCDAYNFNTDKDKVKIHNI